MSLALTEPQTEVASLYAMLGYMRPAGSTTEEQFIERFIDTLGVRVDGYGNRIKRIKRADGTASRVMWSSHTDTVHRRDGMQKLEVTEDGYVFAPQSDCLGADCTAGVWLMVEMIKRNVPGLYIFHRAEEVGGRGSSFIAANTPELLADIDAAIAFDRKDYSSIITHQFGGRCCSDEFGRSLMGQFASHTWKLDDTGSFTDTANYTDLVGECTNVSVGYFDQHTSREYQYVPFLEWMLEVLSSFDERQLVIKRQPGEIDPDDFKGWYRTYNTKGAGYGDDVWGYDRNSTPRVYQDKVEDYDKRTFSRESEGWEVLQDLVIENPEHVTDLLSHLGYTSDDLLEIIYGDKKR